MKIFRLPLLIALACAPSLLAQTSSFDIATFVSPRGWSRTETNGVLVLQARRTMQGRVQFCQIYIFPSQPTNASAAVNFQTEWDAKVGRRLHLAGRPSPAPEASPDGWTSVTDHADVMSQGAPQRVILLTATGFGRFVSVVVSVSPNSYQGELVNFFQSLNFHAIAGAANQLSPAAPGSNPQAPGGSTVTPSSSATASLANYVYTVPETWTRQEMADRILLRSPVYSNGEACQVLMLPLHSSARPLADDAINTFRELFRADPLTTYPSPPPRLARGTSPQGWEYFTIRKLVGGQEGEARTMGAIILAAEVNGQIATIVGTSKDFLVSNCFGDLRGDLWPRFFYGLQFKNVKPTGQEDASIHQRLAGTWMMATGSVGLGYTFQANGRYDDAMATQYRTRASATTDLVTTQGFFGDGAYSFNGNMLVLKRDDNKRTAYFFRLEQVSKDGGRSWVDELCLLEPGSSGEVDYRRQ